MPLPEWFDPSDIKKITELSYLTPPSPTSAVTPTPPVKAEVGFAKPLLRYEEKPLSQLPFFEPKDLEEIEKFSAIYKPEEPPKRGVIGDIASALARGVVVGIPQMAGGIVTGVGALTGIEPVKKAGEEIIRFAEEKIPEAIPFVKPSEREVTSPAWRTLTGMIEAVPTLVAAGGPIGIGAKIGAGILGAGAKLRTIGSMLGQAAGLFGTFGLAGKGQAYKEAKEQGLSEEEAQDFSNKIGLIEGGVWSLLAPIHLGTGVIARRLVTSPEVTRNTIKALLTPTKKESIVHLATHIPPVAGAGMASAALQAKAREAYGLPTPTPEEAATHAIAPAIGLSILFYTGSKLMNRYLRNATFHALTNPNFPEDYRMQAVGIVRDHLRYVDPEVSRDWFINASRYVKEKKPIPIDVDYALWSKEIPPGPPHTEPPPITPRPPEPPPVTPLTTPSPEYPLGVGVARPGETYYGRGFTMRIPEEEIGVEPPVSPPPSGPRLARPGEVYFGEGFTMRIPEPPEYPLGVGVPRPGEVVYGKGFRMQAPLPPALVTETFIDRLLKNINYLIKDLGVEIDKDIIDRVNNIAKQFGMETPLEPPIPLKETTRAKEEVSIPPSPPPTGEIVPPKKGKAKAPPKAPTPELPEGVTQEDIYTIVDIARKIGGISPKKVVEATGLPLNKAKEAIAYLLRTKVLEYTGLGGRSTIGFPYILRERAEEPIKTEPVPFPEGIEKYRKGYGYKKTETGWDIYGPEGKLSTAKSRAEARKLIDDIVLRGIKPPAPPETLPGIETPQAIGTKVQKVTTPQGTFRDVETRFEVVDADRLLTSIDENFRLVKNYPQKFQPRERTTGTSVEQIINIIAKLDPERLAESRETTTGAPIVGPDNIVESGNARAVALKLGYKTENYKRQIESYKQWLIDNAERFGLSKEEIQKIDKPVLIRRRITPLSEEQRAGFARESNAPPIAEKTSAEYARLDAENLTPEVLSLFKPDYPINHKENIDFVRAFLSKYPPSEYNAFTFQKGAEVLLDQKGIDRIQNALFAKAYGLENYEILSAFIADPDSNISNIAKALMRYAPKQIIISEMAKTGDAYPVADIGKDLINAAKDISEIRSRRLHVEDWLRQESPLIKRTPEEIEFVRLFSKFANSPSKIQEALDNFYQSIIELGNPKQATFFGRPEIPDKLTLIRQAIEKVKPEEAPPLFAGEREVKEEAPPPPPPPPPTPTPAPEKGLEVGSEVTITYPDFEGRTGRITEVLENNRYTVFVRDPKDPTKGAEFVFKREFLTPVGEKPPVTEKPTEPVIEAEKGTKELEIAPPPPTPEKNIERLKELGYTDKQINRMTPETAKRIVDEDIPAVNVSITQNGELKFLGKKPTPPTEEEKIPSVLKGFEVKKDLEGGILNYEKEYSNWRTAKSKAEELQKEIGDKYYVTYTRLPDGKKGIVYIKPKEEVPKEEIPTPEVTPKAPETKWIKKMGGNVWELVDEEGKRLVNYYIRKSGETYEVRGGEGIRIETIKNFRSLENAQKFVEDIYTGKKTPEAAIKPEERGYYELGKKHAQTGQKYTPPIVGEEAYRRGYESVKKPDFLERRVSVIENTKEIQPLVSEAFKYTSAEEFHEALRSKEIMKDNMINENLKTDLLGFIHYKAEIPLDMIEPNPAEKGQQYYKYVEEYAKKPAETAPPIIVYGPRYPGDTYQIINGHHRFQAAIMRGDKTITAWVTPVDERGKALTLKDLYNRYVKGVPQNLAKRTPSVQAILEILRNQTKAIDNDVVVFDSFDSVPDWLKPEFKGKNVKAATDINNMKIYIIADRLESLSDAVRTFFHEAIGHYGLLKVMKNDLAGLLDNTWKSHTDKIIDYVKKQGYDFDLNTNIGRWKAAWEYIAHIAEQPNRNPSLLRRAIAYIKQWFFKLFPEVDIGIKDEDIVYYLKKTQKALFNQFDWKTLNFANQGYEITPPKAGVHDFQNPPYFLYARNPLNVDKIFEPIKQFRLKYSLPFKHDDMRILEMVYTLPWYVAKKYPQFKRLIDIQLNREEAREEMNYRLLRKVFEESKSDMHEFLALPKADAKRLFKLMVDSDERNVYIKDNEALRQRARELGIGELTDDMVQAYHAWKKTMDLAWEMVKKQHEMLAFMPYEDKPWYNDFITMFRDWANLDRAGTFRQYVEREAGPNLFKSEAYTPEQIEEMLAAATRLTRSANKIKELRQEMGRWQYYVPRIREKGDLVIRGYNRETDEIVWSIRPSENIDWKKLFKGDFQQLTEPMRARAIFDEMVKRYPDLDWEVHYEPRTPEMLYEKVNDRYLNAFITKAIERAKSKQKITPEEAELVAEALYQSVADDLKARGFASHFITRVSTIEGRAIKGYETEDGQRVFYDYILGLSGFLTKQRAAYDFYVALSDIDPLYEKNLFKYSAQYVEDMLRNQTRYDRISSKLRAGAFGFYLAGNIKSAAVQFTQNFITGIPFLGRVTDNPAKKYVKAMSDIAMGRLTPEEVRVDEAGISKGIATARYLREIKGRMKSEVGGFYDKMVEILAMPFSGMEIYNRRSALLAMYRAVRDPARIDPRLGYDPVAFEKARDFVYDTHYLYGKANLPQWARGGSAESAILWRTAYTFRSFTHNFALSLVNSMRGPEGQLMLDVVGRSLAFMYLFGGAAAIPFMDDLMDALERLTGTPFRDKMRKALKGFGGDMLSRFGMAGAPAVVGFDLSGPLKIEIPSVIKRVLSGETTELPALSSDTVYGVWAGIFDKMNRMVNSIQRGDWDRAIESGSPAFIENVMKAIRTHYEGVTTPSGKPVFELEKGEVLKPTTYETVGQALGFRPYRVAEASKYKREYQNIDAYFREKRQEIYDMLRLHPEKRREIIKEVQKYNLEASKYKGIVPLIKAEEIRQALTQKPPKQLMKFYQTQW